MYHFVGIKGSGMSALAQIMKNLGYDVQGSDVETHFFTEEGLIKDGIKILPFDENHNFIDLSAVLLNSGGLKIAEEQFTPKAKMN